MSTITSSQHRSIRQPEPCCGAAASDQPSTTAQGAVSGAPEAAARVAPLVERLKALADHTRFQMLELLVEQSVPLCVCEITARFALRQPTISHHIRLLREVGLVDGEKRGVWSYYWATDEGRRCLSALRTLA